MMSEDEGAAYDVARQYSNDPYDSDEGMYWGMDGSDLFGRALPTPWRFLHDWYEVLEYRVSIADVKRLDTHDVRIGRGPDDWWIEVNHVFDVHPRGDWDLLSQDHAKRFRKLRETIVLLSIFAKVDYKSWLAELVRTARFRPRKGTDLEMHGLPCKWSFELSGVSTEEPISTFQWTMLRNLFGFGSLSKDFKRDFALATTLALEKGIDVRCMEPIPIQLRLQPAPPEANASQLKALRGLTQVATELLALEAKHAKQQRDLATRDPPVFRVDHLDISFLHFDFNTTVLAELQRFLEAGIRVQTLTLPVGRADRSKDVAAWLPVWGTLLQVIMGTPSLTSAVRRLAAHGCHEILLQPLLSALATANGLEYIRLSSFEYRGPNERSSARLWASLGFALLNASSTSSVTALQISNCRINEHCIQALRQAKEAANPLRYLWRMCSDKESSISSTSHPVALKPATVLKGSKVVPRGCTEATGWFEAATDISGFLVPNDDAADEASTTVALMLPGYGLCTTERMSLQNKRQRISRAKDPSHAPQAAITPRRLQTFLVDFIESYAPRPSVSKYIGELLGVLGVSLTSLAIRADDIPDALLKSALLQCSRLENLRLDGLPIQTMGSLVAVYYRGLQIRSLDLKALSLPAEAFETFLKALDTDPILRRHLERLRFGSKWTTHFCDETGRVCEEMLEYNNRLQHLHVIQNGTRSKPVRFGVGNFHHELVMPRDMNRLAFGSVLRHLQPSVRFLSEESM